MKKELINEIVALDNIICRTEDEYDLTNINGLINVAMDNPELFERLVAAIKSDAEVKFLLSSSADEAIQNLGI